MGESDNDKQRDEKINDYIAFACIVQNYDATSHVEHDDIDFEHDYDGAEYDDDGEPVTLYGVVIYNFVTSVEYDDDWQDYPEDHASLDWDDDDSEKDYGYPVYRFPYYNPRKQPCKRPRATSYNMKQPGVPPV